MTGLLDEADEGIIRKFTGPLLSLKGFYFNIQKDIGEPKEKICERT
jgi:hypothetical protein